MTESKNKVSVLFVCMGNICRSPTAEGVFAKLLRDEASDLDVLIDSAGTHGYHEGATPDQRAMEAAKRRGVDLASLRARQVVAEDFRHFDLILAMDRDNLTDLRAVQPQDSGARLQLYLEYVAGTELDVPDPYYGGAAGFERVLDLVEAAGRGLIESLRRN